jgi:hypothetical protein
MNVKIIEPIGQSETAIRSRLRDLFEKGGHRLFICDTRGLTDEHSYELSMICTVRHLDQEIILRFSVAEVRMSAASSDLCDKLIEAFAEMKIQRLIHSEALRISVAFAAMGGFLKSFSQATTIWSFYTENPMTKSRAA